MSSFPRRALALLLAALPAGASEPFGTVTLSADFELDGHGLDVDTIAIWETPDPSNSLLFVTAKENSLVEVWRHPFVGNEQPPLTHPTFGSSRVNGVIIDQDEDLLYVSISEPASTVSVFTLPELEFVRSFHKRGVDLRSEPNLALLEITGGEKRIYVSADDVVYVHDAATGEYLGEFDPGVPVEALAADRHHQLLHIPDEKKRSGVHVYDADGRRLAPDRHYGEKVFQKDGEGILIYECPAHVSDAGCGLIVVADQRSAASEFEFFDRQTWRHLGALIVEGVSGTDGIASTRVPLPGHPAGFFAAINHDKTTVGVGWARIFAATGWRCPTAR